MDSTDTSPIITSVERWDVVPLAQVRGLLAIRGGCLLLGENLVFWPYGTEWDDSAQAVMSDGQQPPALVGEYFSGGGGYYEANGDFRWLLGADGGRTMRGCIDTTNPRGVVFAYP
jgi:hypothetical protein